MNRGARPDALHRPLSGPAGCFRSAASAGWDVPLALAIYQGVSRGSASRRRGRPLQDNHRAIMTARIFQPARSAMQSGEAKDNWLLEYEPEKPREIEPLMGWTSSSDMRSQVKLKFGSKDEAIAYAERNGIAYRLEEPKPEARKILSYSDNFAPNRIVPWSH